MLVSATLLELNHQGKALSELRSTCAELALLHNTGWWPSIRALIVPPLPFPAVYVSVLEKVSQIRFIIQEFGIIFVFSYSAYKDYMIGDNQILVRMMNSLLI